MIQYPFTINNKQELENHIANNQEEYETFINCKANERIKDLEEIQQLYKRTGNCDSVVHKGKYNENGLHLF